MTPALVTVVLGLGLAGAFPTCVVVRCTPVVVFLAPLVGAVLAAVAVELELVLDGPFLLWFLVVVAAVNGGAFCLRRSVGGGRAPWGTGSSWKWFLVTVGVLVGVMVLPLAGLRTPLIGFDTNAIWLTHTLLVSGGHHTLLAGMQNPAYVTAHPDYPPLVPAAGALAFALFGTGTLRVAVEVTALLNACAVGVVGVGIASIGAGGRQAARTVALIVAAVLCLVGFAVAGDYAVNGYADLLWSAAAVGAVVWGLVLPRNRQALAVAWACAMVAGLTKNEGLLTSLVVLVLISLRYVPVRWPRPGGHTTTATADRTRRAEARGWVRRAVSVVGPALPGLIWVGLVRHDGISDAFFAKTTSESIALRARATTAGMAVHLAVVPVALVVLAIGCGYLRADRVRVGIATPAWLWAAWIGALAGIAGTYVLGSPEIHWWLQTSDDRTTIFPVFLLYADLAVWLVVATDGLLTATGRRSTGGGTAAGATGTTPAGPGGLDAEGPVPAATT
jgi:hypothetical protein